MLKKALLTTVLLGAVLLSPGYGLDQPHLYWAQWSNAGALKDQNYFPIGVWLQPTFDIAKYKAAGVNLYVTGESGLTYAAGCRGFGMPVIMRQSQEVLDRISMFADIVIGWAHQDEPDNAQPAAGGGYDPCISPTTVQSLYNTWKGKDNTRPIFLNFGRGVSDINWIGRGTCTGNWQMYPEYIKGCDVPCYDIYPVNDNQALWYVPKGVDSLISWSKNAKPVWCYIECTDIGDGGGGKPSVPQIKSEIWQSIVHGVNGLLYFCHSFAGGTNEDAILDDATTLAGITEINARIASLAAVINSPTVTGRVTCNASNVDIRVKEYQGDLFVFAAESEGRTASPSFTVTNPPQTTAQVLDENRNLSISGGRFSDSFSIWGVHLYQIGNNYSTGIRSGFKPDPYKVPAIRVTANPFRDRTDIMVTNTAGADNLMLTVYSLEGKVVRTLGQVQNRLTWDGRDQKGQAVPAGMYRILVSGPAGRSTCPVVVIR